MTTIKDVAKQIKGLGAPNDHVAVSILTERDVIESAEARGITLTKEQTEKLVDEIDEAHDVSVGDNLGFYLDKFVREHPIGVLEFIGLLRQTFESSSELTPQFQHFYMTFRSDMKKFLKERGAKDMKFNRGHFHVFGFFEMQGQIWYFSTGDVRWFKKDGMLLRTAKSFEDYTGGSNNTVRFDNEEQFTEDFERITQSQLYRAVSLLLEE
jgi:hypothetical protein